MTKIDKPGLVWGLFPTFISFNLNIIFGTFGTFHNYFWRIKGLDKNHIFEFWSQNLLLTVDRPLGLDLENLSMGFRF